MSTHMNVEMQTVQIADGNEVLTLDYTGALAAHAGESWFGVAVGFRMLQAAGAALSQPRLWDREHLFVHSGHPGGGVRDAVEYVTRCVSRGRYRTEVDGEGGCKRGMRFAWKVEAEGATVKIRLSDGFVPEELYTLLDRLGTPAERTDDQSCFTVLKRRLADGVWQEPLARLFAVELLETKTVHA